MKRHTGQPPLPPSSPLEPPRGTAADAFRQLTVTEKALRESERKYRTLFDSATDAIFIIDPHTGIILDTNQTGHLRLGYRKEEIVGQLITELVPAEFAVKVPERLAHLRQQGIMSFESAHRRKDGTSMPVEIKACVIDFEGRQVLLSIIRDITERKETEDALRRAKAAAEAANQAKSEFLANMSHEVRTPLTSILGMTRLTLDTALSAEQREYLETVRVSSENLLGLINDILDFSKIEAGQLSLHHEEFDLERLSDEVLRLFALPATEKGLALTSSLPEQGLPPLLGDTLRLRQILVNLIGNAIKFTDHGAIRLAVAVVNRGPGNITLQFSVRDTGRGIAPDFLGRICQRFSQADGSISRAHSGVGLGLAITQRLVQLMGGHLTMESELGYGSLFSFSLTFATSTLCWLPVTTIPAAPVNHLPPLTVLLAEDNEANRKLGRLLLTKLGHRVLEADNGLEAVDIFSRGGIDLILMDVQMPIMDGVTTTLTIRSFEKKKGRRVPIVALTAHAMLEDRDRCLAAGMDGYLTKPFELAGLTREFARFYGDGRTMDTRRGAGEETPPPAMTTPAPLPPLRRQEVEAVLSQRYCLDAEDIERLVRSSQKSLASGLDKATAAMRSGDLNELRMAAHSMKGVLLNMGAEAAGLLAKDIEHLADGESTDEATDQLTQLQEMLADFIG